LRAEDAPAARACTRGNDASGRVLEHAGFVRSRVLPGNDILRGVPVDDVEYLRFDPG
jgi:RimJ/RimL family protein N-acetyltransferase